MAAKKDVKNLENESPLLYKAIEDFNISKPWIASKVYEREWGEDEAVQRKLTIRLRNKLNGNGNLSLREIKDIEDALSDFGNSLLRAVEKSKADRSKRLRKTISNLLEFLDEDEKKDLLG